MERIRIAVATSGRGGLEDVVSKVFGRASTFTIVDIEKGEVKSVRVIENPAVSYKHGAGPIVVKTLVDLGVKLVISTEPGPGASALLKQQNVANIVVKPGTSVRESVRKALTSLKKQGGL